MKKLASEEDEKVGFSSLGTKIECNEVQSDSLCSTK